jgi:hypothetical protein
LGTSADPDTLESLPDWFLKAPEGERLGDAAPPLERDEPRELSIDRGYPFY